MNKSTIDRLLHNYQKYDLTDCRIDYEVIEKIASEFSILQQKVNQLETNRDEAIEYIKNCLSGYKEQYEEHTFSYHFVTYDLENFLSILERGKE
jgi:hypothetical protein